MELRRGAHSARGRKLPGDCKVVCDGVRCGRRIEGEQKERDRQKQYDNECRPAQHGSPLRAPREDPSGAQRGEGEQEEESKNGCKKTRPEDAGRPESECDKRDNTEPRRAGKGEILPRRIAPEAEQKKTPASDNVRDPSGKQPGPERLREECELIR